jgi:three-Cys-motif partner protein
VSKTPLDPEKYEPGEDGLTREIVGPWVRDKHARLEKYVAISRYARRRYTGGAGATFIDLYCGPGRARIDGTNGVIDGSPLAAWRKSQELGVPFTQIHVADANPELVEAARVRLEKAGAPVFAEALPAIEAVDRIIVKLDPYGLHFAFLDPYNLAAIPFEIIRKLATLKRMDILIHVSAYDLQRNLRQKHMQPGGTLDAFAPGWQKTVGDIRDQHRVRGKVLEHWRELLRKQGMNTAETHVLVTGPNNQRLYWLAFAARHDLALYFWEQIRDLGPEQLSLFDGG